MRARRLLLTGWVLALGVALGGGAAWAQGDLPAGRFGLVGGLRQSTGTLGNAYGFGWTAGVTAGYQPRVFGGAYDLGLSWEVLWSRLGADDPELVNEGLSLLEMSFGARFRRELGAGTARFFVASAGVTLLRSSLPIPPDDDRIYAGPHAALGIDQYVGDGSYLVGLEARYGLITGGPASLSLVASLAFGTP